MKNKNRFLILAVTFIPLAFSGLAFSQETEIRPVTVGQPMVNITLPTYQGENMSLSSLKGKNVLLIFPRGLAGEARWCHIDNYRYAELMEIEKIQEIRKKHNVEILYVLPYNREVVKEWVDSNPEQLEHIENWKTADAEKLDERGKRRRDFARKAFPKSFILKKGEVPTPFPILIDADKSVSKGLGIFSTDWHGSQVDQCISSVFIVDKEGILQFKYIGQSTFDRPSFEYLLKTLERINRGE